MKKSFTKVLALLFAMIIVFEIIPISAYAATTYYETIKADVPVWSDCYSSSTKVKVLSEKGTVVKVSSSKTNSKGNLWYKMTDGNWIFSGNVKKHTHEAIMCGMPSTTYEQNNASTHIKAVYNGDNLCSCGYAVSKGTTTRTSENHTFNSDGVCTKCKYKKVHEHQAVMCGMSSTTYEQNNASTHIKAVYNGDNLCSCGYVVSKGTTTRISENHTFNSSNVCTKCKYKKVHVHQAVMCGMSSTTYEQNNASTHIKAVYNGDNLCSCGYAVSKGTTTRTSENHTFNSDGVCTKCKYKKVHEHQAVMCGMSSTTYEQNDSSTHIKVYYGGDEKCSCGYVVGKGTTTRTSEKHTFDSTNECIKCGYKKSHKHEAVMTGMSDTTYEYISSSTHAKIYYSGDEKCSCGYVVGKGTTTRTLEGHTFNLNNICTGCGCTRDKTHVHTAVACARETTIAYKKSTGNYHIKVTQTGGEICSCGYLVVEPKRSEEFEEHIYDSNNVCTKCGYKRTHEHQLYKTGPTKTIYEIEDTSNHTKYFYRGDLICSCGEVIEYGKVDVTHEKHTYNSNNVCTKCGYQNVRSSDFFDFDGGKVVSEAFLGNYSDDVSAYGIAAEMVIGEIPIVGTIADVRDVTADIANWEWTWGDVANLAIDTAAILPIFGVIKYVDEVDDGAKAIKRVSKYDDGYDSYEAFKRAYGSAGEGSEWHHIVEQSQIQKSGFSSKTINNANNIIPIDASTHRKISGYYNKIDPVTGKSLRDSIAGLSYEEQYQIGVDALRRFGIIVE